MGIAVYDVKGIELSEHTPADQQILKILEALQKSVGDASIPAP
jgi:hypothetical protein